MLQLGATYREHKLWGVAEWLVNLKHKPKIKLW